MSDRDKLGADHDLDHMLDAIRYKVRRLSDEGDDVALLDVWRHLQAAVRVAERGDER